jgi:succinoglycan biosynthesis protein ExoM
LLPQQAPDWIRRGGFFSSNETEGPLPWQAARTGNALVAGRWFYSNGYRFDEDFGRSGGEDSHLFARLQQAGAELAAAPQAVVAEPVEPERLAFGWLWKRTWRSAETYHRITRELQNAAPPGLQATKRLARAAWLSLLALPALARGRPEGLATAALVMALAGGGLRAWILPARLDSLPNYGV